VWAFGRIGEPIHVVIDRNVMNQVVAPFVVIGTTDSALSNIADPSRQSNEPGAPPARLVIVAAPANVDPANQHPSLDIDPTRSSTCLPKRPTRANTSAAVVRRSANA
jgi:hypothetical protein